MVQCIEAGLGNCYRQDRARDRDRNSHHRQHLMLDSLWFASDEV